MDSRTGDLYPADPMVTVKLKPKVQKRLVEVDGRPEDIRRISKALKKENKRNLEKKKRKESRQSRKRNR